MQVFVQEMMPFMPFVLLGIFVFLIVLGIAIVFGQASQKEQKKFVVTSVTTTSPEGEVTVHDPTKQEIVVREI